MIGSLDQKIEYIHKNYTLFQVYCLLAVHELKDWERCPKSGLDWVADIQALCKVSRRALHRLFFFSSTGDLSVDI